MVHVDHAHGSRRPSLLVRALVCAQLGDHWLLAKLGFYDQSYHVPCIIHDPRTEADASRGRDVSQVFLL